MHHFSRRALSAPRCCAAALTHAQPFPNKPVRIITGLAPAEFGAYLKSESAKWTRVIRQATIKPE